MARNFISWLFGQAHLRNIGERDDLVSDIAYDVHRDINFPKSAKPSVQRDYLSRYGDHITEAWDAARAEYRNMNRLAKMARLARGARVDR